MKKVFFAVAIATAFAFGMTACNNNTPAEAAQDSMPAETEVCAHECNHEGHNCQDTACAAHDCENCTKKGTDECCKKKAGEACESACQHEGEGCAQKHEGCKHACEHANN